MPKKPVISAVMPVYNAERTVAGAINSIISQTYKNWELIIVDDGSTDKTSQEVKKFVGRNNIKFFQRPHCGIPATRNYGNSMAKGTYCIVQDADDYSMPDRLEKVVKMFESSDYRIDVLIHGIYINVWNEQFKCMQRTYFPPNKDLKNNKINGVPAYRKSVWEAKPFREETKYAYDLMMHTDWVKSNFNYTTLNEGLYEYVRYQGSASDRFEKSGQRAESFKKIKEIVANEYRGT